jgi:hypothetical protein
MAVDANNLTFRQPLLQRTSGGSFAHKPLDVRALLQQVVELQDDRIGLTTISAGVCLQVVGDELSCRAPPPSPSLTTLVPV